MIFTNSISTATNCISLPNSQWFEIKYSNAFEIFNKLYITQKQYT